MHIHFWRSALECVKTFCTPPPPPPPSQKKPRYFFWVFCGGRSGMRENLLPPPPPHSPPLNDHAIILMCILRWNIPKRFCAPPMNFQKKCPLSSQKYFMSPYLNMPLPMAIIVDNSLMLVKCCKYIALQN